MSPLPLEVGRLVEEPAVLLAGSVHARILEGFRLFYVGSQSVSESDPQPDTAPRDDQEEDLISWWVACRESDVRRLKEESQRALGCLVRLKRDSRLMLLENLEDWAGASSELSAFCSGHMDDFRTVDAYIRFLSEIPMRPSILWSYAQWGSTRLLERSPPDDWTGGTPVIPKVDLRTATEYVVGARIHASLVNDRYDEPAGPRWMVAEFADYWDRLRMSVDSILNACNSRERLEALIESEGFWSSFVEKILGNEPHENHLWDVKQTLDYWHCETAVRQLKEAQFAERVAAFANDCGGVLIVGITDARPRRVVGVENPDERAVRIADSLARLTALERSAVKVVPFRTKSQSGAMTSCIAIVVAQTRRAAWVRLPDGSYSYPVRDGPGTRRVEQDAINREKFASRIRAPNFSFVDQLR